MGPEIDLLRPHQCFGGCISLGTFVSCVILTVHKTTFDIICLSKYIFCFLMLLLQVHKYIAHWSGCLRYFLLPSVLRHILKALL